MSEHGSFCAPIATVVAGSGGRHLHKASYSSVLPGLDRSSPSASPSVHGGAVLKDAFDPIVVVQVIIPRAPAAPLDFTIATHGADVLALVTWFMLWEIDGRRCRQGRDSPASLAQDREGEAVLTQRMKHACQADVWKHWPTNLEAPPFSMLRWAGQNPPLPSVAAQSGWQISLAHLVATSCGRIVSLTSKQKLATAHVGDHSQALLAELVQKARLRSAGHLQWPRRCVPAFRASTLVEPPGRSWRHPSPSSRKIRRGASSSAVMRTGRGRTAMRDRCPPTPPRLRLRRHGGLLVIDMLKALYRQWPVISRCVLERQLPSGTLMGRAMPSSFSLGRSCSSCSRACRQHCALCAGYCETYRPHCSPLRPRKRPQPSSTQMPSSWTRKPGRRWDLSRPRPIWPSTIRRPTAGERRPVRRPGLYMILAQSRLVCPQIRHQAGLHLHARGAGSDTGRRHPGGSPGRGVDRLH